MHAIIDCQVLGLHLIHRMHFHPPRGIIHPPVALGQIYHWKGLISQFIDIEPSLAVSSFVVGGFVHLQILASSETLFAAFTDKLSLKQAGY